MRETAKRCAKVKCVCGVSPFSVFQHGKSRWSLECPPCKIKTAWCESEADAVEKFNRQQVSSIKPAGLRKVG